MGSREEETHEKCLGTERGGIADDIHGWIDGGTIFSNIKIEQELVFREGQLNYYHMGNL